jgi:hypothetical protein
LSTEELVDIEWGDKRIPFDLTYGLELSAGVSAMTANYILKLKRA